MEPRVYITKIPDTFDDYAWFAGRLLPEEKVRRLEGQQPLRRYASLAAECLLAYGIYVCTGKPPARENRYTNAYGKPFLKSGPYFSLSHSEDMALAAVCPAPVGADIQYKKKLGAGVARRVFSGEEREACREAEDPEAFFFSVWALKESYYKYAGTGVVGDIRSLTCYPSRGSVITTAPDGRFSLFWQGEYCVGVCAGEACQMLNFMDFADLKNRIKELYL